MRQKYQTDNPKNDKFALIGRSEQIDTINAISSSYACQNCCTGGTEGAFITAIPYDNSSQTYEFEVGDTVQFYAYTIERNCYNEVYYCQTTADDWESNHTNVATVNQSGLATIVGVGEVEIDADVEAYLNSEGAPCPTGGYLTEVCENETPKETKEVNNPLLPCGECDTLYTQYHPDADITVSPRITINPPVSALDGETVSFSVTVVGANPSTYLWTFEAPSGAGNNPQVNYSNPTSATTTAKAHWFAKPDTPCPSFDSRYTIKVRVTFQNISPKTKEKYFTVSVDRNWGGAVDPPSTLAPAGTLEVAFNNETGLWAVIGRGTLERVPSPIVMRTPLTSQFYDKTYRHEEIHVGQYATGIFSDLYLIENVMPRLLQLSDPNRQVLEQRAFQTVEDWRTEQNVILRERLRRAEREAYTVSDPIAPSYLFQRACLPISQQ